MNVLNAKEETARYIDHAIQNGVGLKFVYNGFERHVCPHMLGLSKDDRLVVHAFQYAGGDSKGGIERPEQGSWKFFYLDTFESQPLPLHPVNGWYPKDLKKAEGEYKPPKFVKQIISLYNPQ